MKHIKWYLGFLFWIVGSLVCFGEDLPLHDTASFSEQAKQQALLTLSEDCANCHGLYRRGGLGPPLTPERLKHYTVETLAAIIQEGRPALFMPPWKAVLTKEEIHYMATYLLSVDSKPPKIRKVVSQ